MARMIPSVLRIGADARRGTDPVRAPGARRGTDPVRARRGTHAVRVTGAVGRARAGYELFVIMLLVGLDTLLVITSLGPLSSLTGHGPTWWGCVLVGYVALVLLRLRLPAVALLAGVVVATFANHAVLALTVCLSYGAGYRLTRWRGLLTTAALVAGILLLGPWIWEWVQAVRAGATGGPPAWRMPLGGYLAFTYLVPALLGRYSAQRRILLSAVEESNRHLNLSQRLVGEQARLQERSRIARDVHDSLGNHLSLISITANAFAVDGALADWRRDRARALSATAHAALEELRDVVGVLRAGELAAAVDEASTGARTVDRIDDLVARSRAAGARVSVVHSGAHQELSPFGEQAAHRVAQEGLTNAHKHAPGAPVQIGLHYQPDAFIVEVVTGPGAPDAAGGLPGGGQGIIGLDERTRLAGGVLRAGPTTDGGFRLAAVLPYPTAATTAATDPTTTAATTNPRPSTTAATGSAAPTTAARPMVAELLRRFRPGVGAAGSAGEPDHTTGPPGEPDSRVAAVTPPAGRPEAATAANVAQGFGLGIRMVRAIAALLITVVVGLDVAAYLFVLPAGDPRSADLQAELSRELYESVQVGDAQADVERVLSPYQPMFSEAATEQGGGPVSAGVSCRYYFYISEPDAINGPDAVSGGTFRFCFRDARLVEKKILTEGGD